MLFATFSIDIFKITISYYLTYYYYHYYFSPKEWLYKFVTKKPNCWPNLCIWDIIIIVIHVKDLIRDYEILLLL